MIETVYPQKFQPCPSCGYRSARISSPSGSYLVIDSQLPNLLERYEELQGRESGNVILIDRRIGHKSVAGTERRR